MLFHISPNSVAAVLDVFIYMLINTQKGFYGEQRGDEAVQISLLFPSKVLDQLHDGWCREPCA